MKGQNSYRVDLRELEFVLFEQLKIGAAFLGRAPFEDIDADTARELMRLARDFAYRELGTLYQSSDRDGCTLLPNGEVRLPAGFAQAWRQYVDAGWGKLVAPPEQGGMSAPYVLAMPILEIFFGANPAFMIYSGFNIPLFRLIERFGSDHLKALFCDRLASGAWSACMCITEPGAGSDVGNVKMRAHRSDNGMYRIEGGKIFISAGFHDLTENIAYAVLARAPDAPPGTLGLSCFIVPRFRVDSGHEGEDNHVRCVRLEEKMGLHGCATAQLSFGESGPCYGWLLGDRENGGLKQLLVMMTQARIGTAIFSLGMASSAYLNAAEYADGRVQGASARQTFNPSAIRLPIIEHHDVRRMLLEMKSKSEGCRALTYKLAFHETQVKLINEGIVISDDAERRRHEALLQLLTPIVKAYTSDQAWRIAELAIQVHGGYGYTRDFPVEQYARDIKIMSIWEGTNYIQAADLIRDKLAMGSNSRLFSVFANEIREFTVRHANVPVIATQFATEFAALTEGLETLERSLDRIAVLTRVGRVELVFAFATRFLDSMAEVSIAWLLLDAAVIAAGRLADTAEEAADADDTPFYKGKVLSARYFFCNHLPLAITKAGMLDLPDDSVLEADRSVFLRRSQLYV